MLHKLIRSVFLNLIIAVVVIQSPVAASAEFDQKIEERISTLMEALPNNGNELDALLMKKGFPPRYKVFYYFRDLWNFNEWPNIRKLETVYVMAEANKTGSGEKLLKDLAFEIANKHNIAIVDEPGLKSYFPEGKDTVKNIKNSKRNYKFKSLSDNKVDELRERLDLKIRSIIKAISIYTPSFPGGPINAMARCCSISEKTAYEILRKSSSIETAIEKAIESGKIPSSILSKLKLLYEYVRGNNIAIESEVNSINEVLTDIEAEFSADKSRLISKVFGLLISDATNNHTGKSAFSLSNEDLARKSAEEKMTLQDIRGSRLGNRINSVKNSKFSNNTLESFNEDLATKSAAEMITIQDIQEPKFSYAFNSDSSNYALEKLFVFSDENRILRQEYNKMFSILTEHYEKYGPYNNEKEFLRELEFFSKQEYLLLSSSMLLAIKTLLSNELIRVNLYKRSPRYTSKTSAGQYRYKYRSRPAVIR